VTKISFTKACACCGRQLLSVEGGELEAWRREVKSEGGHQEFMCGECGCELKLTDDRTSIGHRDVSRPQVRSVVLVGRVAHLTGHRLAGARLASPDSATLTVLGEDAAEVVLPPPPVTPPAGLPEQARDWWDLVLENENGRHKALGRVRVDFDEGDPRQRVRMIDTERGHGRHFVPQAFARTRISERRTQVLG